MSGRGRLDRGEVSHECSGVAQRRGYRLARKGARLFPPHRLFHARLAGAYAIKGDTERVAAELTEARGLSSDDVYSSIARVKAASSWGVPKMRALYEATYLAGLSKAGMPKE